MTLDVSLPVDYADDYSCYFSSTSNSNNNYIIYDATLINNYNVNTTFVCSTPPINTLSFGPTFYFVQIFHNGISLTDNKTTFYYQACEQQVIFITIMKEFLFVLFYFTLL